MTRDFAAATSPEATSKSMKAKPQTLYVAKPHIEADLPSQILRVTDGYVNTTAMWGFVSILHPLRVERLVTTDYRSGLFSPSLPILRFTSLRADRNPFSIWGFMSI